MPTNNKTSLGLNSWLGTDKPKRSDFVADNTLLDSLLTAHFHDTAKHLSTDDRAKLAQPFVVGDYQGNGAATQDITLPFPARIALVFYTQKPANVYNQAAGYNESNFAVVSENSGMAGAILQGNVMTVCQSTIAPPAGGNLYNFNVEGEDYAYIAFR